MPLLEQDFSLLDLVSIRDGAIVIPSTSPDSDLTTVVGLNSEGKLAGIGIATVWLALARMAGSSDRDIYTDYANEAMAYLREKFWPLSGEDSDA